MHQSFKFSMGQFENQELYDVGAQLNAIHRAQITRALDPFRDQGGALDAGKMTDNWFPQVQAHVFLSHSHSDERLAITLSGLLSKFFGLVAFVDSCVWAHADILLRLIDNEHCYQASTATYSYERRNKSTSHVHMMLSVALAKMMDATECILFLNTPASISAREVVSLSGKAFTPSPWLYYELAMTGLIQTRPRSWYRGQAKFAKRIDEEMKIMHPVNLEGLTDLSVADLNRWLEGVPFSRPEDALDALYANKRLQ